jgi:hypothetical protein
MKYVIKSLNGEMVAVVIIKPEVAQNPRRVLELRQELPLCVPELRVVPLIFAWQNECGNLIFDSGARIDIQYHLLLRPPQLTEFLDLKL